MKQLFEGKRWAGAGAIVFGLLFSSFALANILSGSSTTNVSNDVAYTALTLSEPLDAVPGDVLLANVSVNGGSPAAITAPTGWVAIARADNDTNVSVASYYKVVGTSEPTSYTWSISPQTHAVGGITRYSGVDTSNPIDVASTSLGRGTVASAPSVVTTAANDQVVALFATDYGKNNSGFFSTSTGMTKLYDAKNKPYGPTTGAQGTQQTSAGSIGPFSATINTGQGGGDDGDHSNRDWVAQTIALRMQPPTTLTNGLLDYYKLNGNSTDALGLNNGADHNSPTYSIANGIINQGVGFNGVNQYITANSINPSTYDSGLSISAWFKPADTTYGVPFNLTQLGVCNTQIVFTGSTIYYRFTDSYWHIGVGYSAGNWYHVVITHNGSTEKIYVNGILQHTDTGGSLLNCAATLGLGAGIDGIGNIWPGAVDEVGMWGRELSQSEVTNLYNNGAGNSYPF